MGLLDSIGGIAGSLLGGMMGGGQDYGVAPSFGAALQVYEKLVPPGVADTAIRLQRAVLQGKITPDEAVAQLTEASRLAGVQAPPELERAQYDALYNLKTIADSGGLTAIDRAQLADIQRETASKEQGQRQAIMQNMQERGIAGSGMELAQKLMAQQAGADRSAQGGLDVAALAQKRALEALSQYGTQAGQMRTQDVNEQTAKAQAQDAINKFNAEMRQKTELSNVEARNAAQQQNLKQLYDIQTQNMAQQKAEEANKANQANTRWDQQLAKAKGMSGAYQNLGAQEDAQSARGAKEDSDFMGGIVKAIPSVISLFSASDERLKDNKQPLTDQQVNDMLNQLTGYSYNYNGQAPDNVAGTPSVGVMAQDMEKTPLESDVIDTPQGKMVMDTPHKQSLMLAALANINKRLNNLEGR